MEVKGKKEKSSLWYMGILLILSGICLILTED